MASRLTCTGSRSIEGCEKVLTRKVSPCVNTTRQMQDQAAKTMGNFMTQIMQPHPRTAKNTGEQGIFYNLFSLFAVVSAPAQFLSGTF